MQSSAPCHPALTSPASLVSARPRRPPAPRPLQPCRTRRPPLRRPSPFRCRLPLLGRSRPQLLRRGCWRTTRRPRRRWRSRAGRAPAQTGAPCRPGLISPASPVLPRPRPPPEKWPPPNSRTSRSTWRSQSPSRCRLPLRARWSRPSPPTRRSRTMPRLSRQRRSRAGRAPVQSSAPCRPTLTSPVPPVLPRPRPPPAPRRSPPSQTRRPPARRPSPSHC